MSRDWTSSQRLAWSRFRVEFGAFLRGLNRGKLDELQDLLDVALKPHEEAEARARYERERAELFRPFDATRQHARRGEGKGTRKNLRARHPRNRKQG